MHDEGVPRKVGTVGELLSDVTLRGLVPGRLLMAGGHRYRVLAETDLADVTTAGGLRLSVEPSNGVRLVTAYGDIGAGQMASDTIARALDSPGSYLFPAGHYVIDRAMIVGSDTTIYFASGVRIDMAEGVQDNLIRNANATAPLDAAVRSDSSVTYATHNVGEEVRLGGHRYVVIDEAAQTTDLTNAAGTNFIPALDRNITLIGESFDAVLDQNGTVNRDETQVERWRWHGLLFEGVQQLEVTGFTLRDTTRYGVNCQSGCYDARIHALNFDQPGWDYGRGIPNQDCVNIRHGSRDVYVGYIYGRCGDDVIALTGLQPSYVKGSDYVPSAKPNNINMNVAYRPRDIQNVTVENIYADAGGSHHIVRVLRSDDVPVHHIFISDIHETTGSTDIAGNQYGREAGATAAVLIGSGRYGSRPHRDSSLMHNIHISNISTQARTAVRFQWSAEKVYMSDISMTWDAETSSDIWQGQTAYVVAYDYEDSYPPPSGYRATYRDHYLDGAFMAHDGLVRQPGDVGDLGIAVFFDKRLDVRDSVYSGVVIREARHVVQVGEDVTLSGVLFEDFVLFSMGQMPFRILGEDVGERLDWAARDFTVMDRGRLWAGTGNAGEFYSASNNMRLLGGMPNVVPNEPAPMPVDGSRVRFTGGSGGFKRDTDAVARNGNWVAE